jgi:hypothetical protein
VRWFEDAMDGKTRPITNLMPSAVIALLGFACYMPVLGHYFWEDDFMWIEEGRAALSNPALFFKFQPNFRPLCRLFFAVCWKLFGFNPAPYYFLALSIHVAAGIAVYFALTALLKDRRVGFAAAALFTVTNTHSDAVFWIVANCGAMGLLFFALGIMAWVGYREKRGPLMYWLSVACMVLALFSKEDAMTYPVLLVLADILLVQPEGVRLKDRIKEYVPFAIILAAFALLMVYLQSDPARRSSSIAAPGVLNFSPQHLYSNLVEALFYMLLGVKAFEPGPSLLVMTLTVIAVIAVCAWSAGKRKAAWAALWTLVPFLPICGYAWDFYLSVESGSIRRHLYAPSLGASVLVALLLAGLFSKAAAASPRLRSGAAVAFVLVVALFSAYQFSQVRQRSATWGERTLILKAEAEAVMKLNPRPEQPAGFVLADFAQRPFYDGDMLRLMYGDRSITHYNTWAELESNAALKGRYMVRIKSRQAGTVGPGTFALDVGTGRVSPVDIKDTYK